MVVISTPWWLAPRNRSCPREHKKCASPAAACERSGSSAGKNTSKFGLPRRSHATNCPLRKITSAYAARVSSRGAVSASSSATGSSGQRNTEPYGLAGSVAANCTNSGFSWGGAVRNCRSKSTAAGSANCVAPSPATKYPRRMRPLSSSAFSTSYTALNPPGTFSAATCSRSSTP